MFPLFGLVRGVYLMNFHCAAYLDCYGSPFSLSASDELVTIIASLYINAVVYMLVGAYLDQVLPAQYGVPRHPCFCIPRALRCRRGAERRQGCVARAAAASYR